jgi:hypothetical protein
MMRAALDLLDHCHRCADCNRLFERFGPALALAACQEPVDVLKLWAALTGCRAK